MRSARVCVRVALRVSRAVRRGLSLGVSSVFWLEGDACGSVVGGLIGSCDRDDIFGEAVIWIAMMMAVEIGVC